MDRFSNTTKYLLFIAALFIASNLYFPIWRIDLDAPQYPEGLRMLIYHDKLGGDVEIINGLNHYIGMKTLHAEEFVEFSILRYIFVFFALLTLVIGFTRKKKLLVMLFILFALFGALAMVDFWRWEYEYGHNLDPTAAIIVPGMAYQPPLIGFKQLLNFGAYSIPAIGGWLLLIAGLIMFFSCIMEYGLIQKTFKSKILFFLPLLFFISCTQTEPEPILLHKDTCAYCKMTISNGHFGAEIITEKGRIYKFDDIKCLLDFSKKNVDKKIINYYVHDYLADNVLLPAELATYIKDENLKSPMTGNIAAFKNEEEREKYNTNKQGMVLGWKALINQ